ncbi:MAG TPA: hypothetical protein VJT81_06525 [Burkholderiales bacterium]|nr:hypothetical protein [Burkholderiales bacterium]
MSGVRPGFLGTPKHWLQFERARMNQRHGLATFTANGEFIVPEGVFTLWVSGAGGGGGGGGAASVGGTGGTTSFGSFITLLGGAGGGALGAAAQGGFIAGGWAGDYGVRITAVSFSFPGKGGDSPWGSGGESEVLNSTNGGRPGTGFGTGGSGATTNTEAGGGGGGGQIAMDTPVTVVPGQRISVTIGAAGTTGGTPVGGAATGGIIIVKW